MITSEESIPSKGKSYRIGEEVLYRPFNDVSFYVEDEDQENFFFCIIKKLFPDIKLEKIFPLNGKNNVISHAKENICAKNQVFIVDKDFDDILNKIVTQNNLFYLDRYSIENYLIEENALVEYIISERPKLNKATIPQQFDIGKCLTTIFNTLREITYLHIVVQMNCLRLKNISLNHERFINMNNGCHKRHEEIKKYKQEIEGKLKDKDKRLTINGQINKAKRKVSLNSMDNCKTHIPGKHSVKMLKQLIESSFGLTSNSTDSFCYRVAEKSNFSSLNELKIKIENYIEG